MRMTQTMPRFGALNVAAAAAAIAVQDQVIGHHAEVANDTDQAGYTGAAAAANNVDENQAGIHAKFGA